MIVFENKPSTKTPVNDKNLNANFKEIEDTLYYKDGDNYIIDNQCYTGGALTGSAKEIIFSLVVPKSLKKINKITINSLNIVGRITTGGYAINGTIDSSKVNAYKGADNIININVVLDTASNAPNNTPINIYIRTANIIFNE